MAASQQREQQGPSPPWADLPPELLERTLALLGPRDRVSARFVCASWRACVRDAFRSDLPFEAPRLLHRRPQGSGGGLAFFSLHHRKLLPFALPQGLPAARCCGHTRGWLAMALDAHRSLVLCHIASGRSVAVPPPPVFPVSKVILSGPPTSSPSPEGWVAAALGRTGTMALLQQQPSSSCCWRTIGVYEGADHGGFRDMAFWSGRLCALAHDGAVLAFRADLGARKAAMSVLREADPPVGVGVRAGLWALYLVEADGELLLVRKRYTLFRWVDVDAADVEVEVHALESPGDRRWGQLQETPGRALFVGSVASAVLPVALYPEALLRESCVYLARREVEMLAPHAICEYSLPEQEMRSVPIAGGHSADVDPVWIAPFV